MDSGILSQVLDDIRGYGGDYVIDRFDVGHDARGRVARAAPVSAEDEESLQRLLMRLQTRGVNQVDPGEARSPPSSRTASSPTASTRRPTS